MAYYNVLFDRAVDECYELIGIGLDYLKPTAISPHRRSALRYLRELKEGHPVRVTFSCSITTPAHPLFRAAAARRQAGFGHLGKHELQRRHARRK